MRSVWLLAGAIPPLPSWAARPTRFALRGRVFGIRPAIPSDTNWEAYVTEDGASRAGLEQRVKNPAPRLPPVPRSVSDSDEVLRFWLEGDRGRVSGCAARSVVPPLHRQRRDPGASDVLSSALQTRGRVAASRAHHGRDGGGYLAQRDRGEGEKHGCPKAGHGGTQEGPSAAANILSGCQSSPARRRTRVR